MNTPDPFASSLRVSALNRAEVWALVRDLEARATVHSVFSKRGPRAHSSSGSGDGIGLSEGVALLMSGEISGLQFRYRLEDKEWCDTLMAESLKSFRLVRLAET